MTELVVFGVAGAFWVKTIVNLLKAAKLPDNLAIPAALIVGVALAVCVQFSQSDPEFAKWFRVVVGGITAALMAMNLYDVTHTLDKLVAAK